MLDENTVQYMIDDMQDKIDEQAVTIDKQASTIDELQVSNQEQASTIGELQARIRKLEQVLKSK